MPVSPRHRHHPHPFSIRAWQCGFGGALLSSACPAIPSAHAKRLRAWQLRTRGCPALDRRQAFSPPGTLLHALSSLRAPQTETLRPLTTSPSPSTSLKSLRMNLDIHFRGDGLTYCTYLGTHPGTYVLDERGANVHARGDSYVHRYSVRSTYLSIARGRITPWPVAPCASCSPLPLLRRYSCEPVRARPQGLLGQPIMNMRSSTPVANAWPVLVDPST